jgi:3-hydroxyacyl-[acyl-carrier-protein] dehydratase
VSSSPSAEPDRAARGTLFDLTGVDLSACVADRAAIGRVNPHRHEMALLDEVVWLAKDRTSVVARHRCTDDAMWVRGHFPGMPLMPGVLQIEAGAQLACYLWNIQQDAPRVAAFLRIEDAAFRRSVRPGDDLLLLCRELKKSRRRFVSEIQGVVDGQIAFEGRITGMAFEETVQSDEPGV